MFKKSLLTGALAAFLALTFSGCSASTASSSTDAVPAQSQAYTDGYNGNIGLSPAVLSQAGSPSKYCKSIVALHPDYTAQEQADYIQGCLDVIANGSTSSSSNDSTLSNGDLLSRLQSVGGDNWDQDPIAPIVKPTGFTADYLAEGACTLWVFDNGTDAQAAANNGFLDGFTSFTYSWGTDGSGAGVIAMYQDESSPCASDMLTTLGWGAWPK